MKKHSPLPWDSDICPIDIKDANGKTIARLLFSGLDATNARFIVRACNHHDEMRAFAQRMAEHGDVPQNLHDSAIVLLARLEAEDEAD